MFLKRQIQKKNYFVVGNFHLNCLDYINNLEIRTFCNWVFAHGYIPLIMRPSRVTSKTVCLIDNFIFGTSLKLQKRIIKSDVSDHFPEFVSLNLSSKIHKENKKITIHKRVMHDTNLTTFKTDLWNFTWNSINNSPETNSKYEQFFKIF